MAGVQAVLTGLIFVLSIRWGEGGLSPAEMVMIAIAGAGVAGWIVADEPLVATVCVVAADLIGAAMMVPKTTATRTRRRSYVRVRQPRRGAGGRRRRGD